MRWNPSMGVLCGAFGSQMGIRSTRWLRPRPNSEESIMHKFLPCALVCFLFAVVAGAQDSSSGAPAQLSALKAAARITRDTDGIAHIRAQNEHDLFFLQGYVHAQDRLFQMDVSRREASGTLAELWG